MSNKQGQEPQISLELNGSVIQLELSIFNDILEREINKFILENDIVKKNIIDPKELKKSVEYWKSKYEKLETEAKILESVIKRLKRDLKKDKFAQPHKCKINSIGQNVKVISSNKLNMANAHKNTNKEVEIITISDSEDEIVIISDVSKTNQQTINENVIDLIDSDNDTQNDNDKVLN